MLKRGKTKLARDQEKKKKKRREREKDQQVAPQQVEHQQAEVVVVVVALLPEKRRKTVNESEDLAAEAMKRERRKGLVVGREKEIRKEIERDAQEVAIVQLLLVHDQRVEVQNKKSLSQGTVLFKSKSKVCYESQLDLILILNSCANQELRTSFRGLS